MEMDERDPCLDRIATTLTTDDLVMTCLKMHHTEVHAATRFAGWNRWLSFQRSVVALELEDGTELTNT